MITVTGSPTNEAGGVTLTERVKISIPSTRKSSRTPTLIVVLLTVEVLVPATKVTVVGDRVKSSPTANDR